MSNEENKTEKPKKGSISLTDLPNVECKCGSLIWEYGFILKRIDSKPTGVKNIPVDIIMCKRCGNVLQDGVPLLRKPLPEVKD